MKSIWVWTPDLRAPLDKTKPHNVEILRDTSGEKDGRWAEYRKVEQHEQITEVWVDKFGYLFTLKLKHENWVTLRWGNMLFDRCTYDIQMSKKFHDQQLAKSGNVRLEDL
jgi:hypothetical protein